MKKDYSLTLVEGYTVNTMNHRKVGGTNLEAFTCILYNNEMTPLDQFDICKDNKGFFAWNSETINEYKQLLRNKIANMYTVGVLTV